MAQSTRQPPAQPRQETDAERQAREDADRKQQAAAEEEQARKDAEAKTAHLPRQGETAKEPMTPAEAAEALEDDDTVLMNFPTSVTLTLPGYRVVAFPAGVQPVPSKLKDDPYLEACGATPMREGARH